MIRPIKLALVIVLGVAIVAFTALHVDRLVGGESGDPCASLTKTPTRHRSGTPPTDPKAGLRRRECSLVVRAARAVSRQPTDYEFDLVESSELQFPSIVDSNSPAFWDGSQLLLFNSAWMETYRSSAESVDDLAEPIQVDLPQAQRPGTVWIEALWNDTNTGVLYGWYHFEPSDDECKTAPLIGAAVSYDAGLNWQDRGFILENGYAVDCDYDNGYFSGGNGDLTVVPGPSGRYLYFLFSNYAGPLDQQGVTIARSSLQDIGQPGTVFKFYNNAWTEPGIGGKATALLASSTGWKGPFVEAYWGPSVHWNTYLKSYVMLLNHTQGETFSQEGIYISFSKDLLNWTAPRKILDSNDWYPEILGLGPNDSDSVAGQDMRLYVAGISNFVLHFRLDTVAPDSVPQ